MQEVETDQFYKFFLPELKRDGYEGIFSPKSRAKTMSESDRKHVDGCAIFYRTSKFVLVKEQLVEFNQLAIEHANGHEDMLNRVMTKDNIALAALLQTKEACWEGGAPPDHKDVAQPILVCSAHIHWDPEFCDVKLIQSMMLMEQLRQIMENFGHSFRPGHKKAGPESVQLLLCADFNSLPESGVIEFIKNGRVPTNHPDLKDIGYADCLMKMLSHSSNEKDFTHNFQVIHVGLQCFPCPPDGERLHARDDAIHQLHFRLQGHHRLHILPQVGRRPARARPPQAEHEAAGDPRAGVRGVAQGGEDHRVPAPPPPLRPLLPPGGAWPHPRRQPGPRLPPPAPHQPQVPPIPLPLSPPLSPSLPLSLPLSSSLSFSSPSFLPLSPSLALSPSLPLSLPSLGPPPSLLQFSRRKEF
jgi:hypothetical protein